MSWEKCSNVCETAGERTDRRQGGHRRTEAVTTQETKGKTDSTCELGGKEAGGKADSGLLL